MIISKNRAFTAITKQFIKSQLLSICAAAASGGLCGEQTEHSWRANLGSPHLTEITLRDIVK